VNSGLVVRIDAISVARELKAASRDSGRSWGGKIGFVTGGGELSQELLSFEKGSKLERQLSLIVILNLEGRSLDELRAGEVVRLSGLGTAACGMSSDSPQQTSM
jgi:hypothetical protein